MSCPAPTICSTVIAVFVSVLCRGEFQVGPSPVPPGYPRAPCVPVHHPSAAGRPHVSVLHLCDVLSDCCFAAGKPQHLIRKEPLRYCENKTLSRLNRSHSKTSSSGPHFQSFQVCFLPSIIYLLWNTQGLVSHMSTTALKCERGVRREMRKKLSSSVALQ